MREIPFLGSVASISRDALGFFTHAFRTQGDRVWVRVLGRDVLLLCHHDDIEDVLVRNCECYTRSAEIEKLSPVFGRGLLASDGDLWRKQRAMIRPSFGHACLASYAGNMISTMGTILDAWPREHTIDIHREMMRYTREVIWNVLFGETLQADSEIGPAVTTAFGELRSEVLYLPLWRRLPLKRSRKWTAAVRLLNETIRSKIASRRAAERENLDMLSALLDARDVDGAAMSDEQLHDEILTFFVAGHETAALSLTWASYLPGLHPDIQDRVRKEVVNVTNGAPLSPEHLSMLPLTAAAVKEALRLYPPIWSMGRKAVRETLLAGGTVPEHADIWICLYKLHRDERWYEQAECFLPDRWLSNQQVRNFTFLPFGSGPRACIGQPFALSEAILGLAAIMANRIILPPRENADVSAWITLRPRNRLLLSVRAV